MSIEFVKGHCGWDALTLIPATQVPEKEQLDVALKVAREPVDGGLEVGYMGKGAKPDEIVLKIAANTQQNWIPMCGGMTQVIGKALVETFFREHFEIDVNRPQQVVNLLTDSSTIPLVIDIENRKAVKVTSVMDEYVAFLYEKGVEPLVINGVDVTRVGDFLVLHLDALERVHPDVDFTRRDAGVHLDIIREILISFEQQRGLDGVYGMMFDHRPEGDGQLRIYPRFYSARSFAEAIPYEFQCGTGTVAVGVAVAHHGLLPFDGDKGTVTFEWGSQQTTPDPYGIRLSELNLALCDGQVTEASFSHSVIEILAEGKLTIPEY